MPPGAKFTFRVHNAGSAHKTLVLGCGSTLPIMLQSANGPAALVLDDNSCFGDGDGSCHDAFMGKFLQECSDCGPGDYDDLPAGAVVDFSWDHVGWVQESIPAQCVADAGSSGDPDFMSTCQLAFPMPPSTKQEGSVTVCNETDPHFGTCVDADETEFTIDTTKSEATIDVL